MISALAHAPLWLRLLIDALACWRLTRLVVADTFPPILWARERIVARFTRVVPIYEQRWKPLPVLDLDPSDQGHPLLLEPQTSEMEMVVIGHQDKPGALAELVECPHCSSVWLGFGIVAAESLFPGVWGIAALALALSAVAGYIVGAE